MVPHGCVGTLVDLWCRVAGVSTSALLKQQDAELLRALLLTQHVVMWRGDLEWNEVAVRRSEQMARELGVGWSSLAPEMQPPAVRPYVEPPCADVWHHGYCVERLTPTAQWEPVEVTGGMFNADEAAA